MAYSDFKTLKSVQQKFDLSIDESPNLFSDITPIEPTPHLSQTLQETVQLAIAINTEKARSEMMITPVLLEVRRQAAYQVSLFSGIEFDVDQGLGLVGYCDYILSRSHQQLTLNAPVVMVTEAKNENIKAGLGQCLAEMVAARTFNLQEQNSINRIYGSVTTGEIWKFLSLTETVASIDLMDYYLVKDTDKILGILLQGVNTSNS